MAGLCLCHFRRVAARLEGEVQAELSQRQVAKFAHTQEHLRQIIEKMDAGRKPAAGDEAERAAARAIGEEREALQRAIWQMAGLEDIS